MSLFVKPVIRRQSSSQMTTAMSLQRRCFFSDTTGGALPFSTSVVHNTPRKLLNEKETLEEISRQSKKKSTSISLMTLMSYYTTGRAGQLAIDEQKLLTASRFLHSELQLRCAKMVALLDQAPNGLNLMPSVRRVREWYYDSFSDLHHFHAIKNEKDDAAFSDLLEKIYARHGATHSTVARGLHELKCEISKTIYHLPPTEIDFSTLTDVHQCLDRFYFYRISLRMLIGHHIELHHQRTNPRKDFVGVICRSTSPNEQCRAAAEDATFMCEKQFRVAPAIEIQGNLELTFPFLPSFIYYIVLELLKNSMRATVEHYKRTHDGKLPSDSSELPPVKIIISGGKETEDVTIRISDMGGGIRRKALPKVWSYLYTTADLTPFDEHGDWDRESPMAGLGVGLPLSRLYSRYFGGDLQLCSVEGYGSDVYVYLPRSGTHSPNLETGHLGAEGIQAHFNVQIAQQTL